MDFPYSGWYAEPGSIEHEAPLCLQHDNHPADLAHDQQRGNKLVSFIAQNSMSKFTWYLPLIRSVRIFTSFVWATPKEVVVDHLHELEVKDRG
ncbi:MAG TPA: hypothetical protein VFQ43_21640 [Nitrososphaera sp.]|nr:hypothetical protein [Nitrososphaera sp.]